MNKRIVEDFDFIRERLKKIKQEEEDAREETETVEHGRTNDGSFAKVRWAKDVIGYDIGRLDTTALGVVVSQNGKHYYVKYYERR